MLEFAENPKLSLKVAKHALFWVSASIGLDYLTSWTMMSLLGPTAENSAVTRAFFEARNLATFSALLESQVTWLVILVVSLISFLVWRFRPRAFDRPPLSPQK